MGDEPENLELHSEALVASTVPGSIAEALADPNWKAAMKREYDSLMTNEVWSLVSQPTERQPITGKWLALCGESERGRQNDKVKGTFCGVGLHANTWLRLPRDVLTNGQTVNVEDSACVRRETGHQVTANGHIDSQPEWTHRRRDFSGAARWVLAERR